MFKTPLESSSSFHLPPLAFRPTSPFSSSSGSSSPSSSSPRSPHSPLPSSPHFIDQVALAKFKELCDFNPIAKRTDPKPELKKGQSGQNERISLLFDETKELFNYFAPRYPIGDRWRSCDLEAIVEPAAPKSSGSCSDQAFACEYFLEKRALERIEQAKHLHNLGYPLNSAELKLLKKIVEKNKKLLSLHKKPPVFTLTPGLWRGVPIVILYFSTGATETVRFYFPNDGLQGSSKKVPPLWALNPPGKQALLIADAYSKETATEFFHLMLLQGNRHTVALQESFEERHLRFFIQPYYPSTLMESINKLTTARYYEERSAYSDPQKKQIASQLVSAISYLHRLNIIHRDVKPENVLLDPASDQIALCDFGYACSLDDKVERCLNPGTRIYAAPECLSGQGSSTASDIWGVGMLLWILFAEELPIWLPPLMQDPIDYNEAFRQMELFSKRLSGSPQSEPLCRLFLAIFAIDPKKRPTIFEISSILKEIFNTPSTATLYARLQK